MSVDVSDLVDGIRTWANDGAGQALDALRQHVRDGHFPYGVYDSGATQPDQHIADSETATIEAEGDEWHGSLAYTAEHASYQDEGSGPITGNPWLYFYWQGHLIRVHETSGYDVWTGWFTDYTTEDDWVAMLEQSLGDLA